MVNLYKRFGYLYDIEIEIPRNWFEIGVYMPNDGACLWTYVHYEGIGHI